jgi:MFS family permease
MPDVVTEPAPAPTHLRQALPYALEALAVLALFAAVGAGAGWLWFQVWHQPTGTVVAHDWFTDEAGLRNVFDGTAWYVVLAAAGALLAGALATVFARRSPLVTMAAVLLGSALAAWLMLRVGLALSPPDPEVLAKTADEGTKLPGRLSLEGGHSPYLVWPLAALIALMVLNFLLSSRDDFRDREAHDQRWLSRNQPG